MESTIEKLRSTTLILMAVACFTLASVDAQAIQVIWSSTPSQGVWDVTGNYPNEELNVTNNIDLVQDDKGRITGTGTGTGTEDGITVNLVYKFAGAIKRAGSVTRVTWTMKIAGSATDGNITLPVTGSIKMTMEVDKTDNILIGFGAGKICVPRQCERVDGPVQFDLPQPMDGSWNLTVDLQSPDGKKLVGTGEATLSNGRVIPFIATGQQSANRSRFKLNGTGGTVAFGPASSHALGIFALVKAKLLGQNIPVNP